MIRKLLKLSLVCVTGTLIFTANPKTAMAFEEGVAGYTFDKDSICIGSDVQGVSINLTVSDIPIPGFKDIGIAKVDTNLLIRSEPGENAKIIGKLPKNGGCDILESNKNGWTKIKAEAGSETLIGYVKSEYLITGSDATQLARQIGYYVAVANTDGLNVRKAPSVNAELIDQIAKGEELLLLDSKVVTDDKEYGEWVKVSLDSDDEESSVGYIYKKYVDLSFKLIRALSMSEIQYGSGVSDLRRDLIDKAKDYLGNRYVFGGTSLTNGIDCSAYVQAIYRKFNITLPRTSREQARSGKKISESELKPGDLVFYGSSSYINHVAMYIGNGKVIHASNKRDGIKISTMKYRTPVKYARFIND